MSAVEFATDLPPNSPEGRESPASRAGPQSAVLAFQSGEGDSNPRDLKEAQRFSRPLVAIRGMSTHGMRLPLPWRS